MANTTELKLSELESLIRELAWNDGYGCYTRAGFEKMIWNTIRDRARWIIFFDIDDMHTLNSHHGYEGVNAIIKKSLAMRGSDFMAGQWFSGDEFIVCITDGDPDRGHSDPIEFAMRLSALFKENGAPATFAIAPVTSDDLFANVMPAHQLCQRAKNEYRRGTINIVPGEPR
jgi:GGDEF domain-containing protein